MKSKEAMRRRRAQQVMLPHTEAELAWMRSWFASETCTDAHRNPLPGRIPAPKYFENGQPDWTVEPKVCKTPTGRLDCHGTYIETNKAGDFVCAFCGELA